LPHCVWKFKWGKPGRL